MSETNIAFFEKVSRDQYIKDRASTHFTDPLDDADELKQKWNDEYDQIVLPRRATTGSAGYDFCLPYDETIGDLNGSVVISTGIRVRLDQGWMLAVFPRSGLGFKYGTRLLNTVGIIDSDYYHAANEGHIMIKLTADQSFCLKAGDRFAQGVLIPYGLASNDYVLMKQRVGGFGSTGGMQ